MVTGDYYQEPGPGEPCPAELRVAEGHQQWCFDTVPNADPAATLMVIGNSHVHMRIPAIEELAGAEGRLRGKQPKLSPLQRRHLMVLHAQGEHSQAEPFGAARSTIYRTVQRESAASRSEVPDRRRAPRRTARTPPAVLPRRH